MHLWMLPEWIRIWFDTARFGRPGFSRRNKEDVAKNLRHAEMLLPRIALSIIICFYLLMGINMF
jgi:hypothetical protein